MSQPRSRDSWGPRTWKRQEGPSPGGFGLGTGPCNTLVTASWPPELGENELVMFKQPSLWSLVKAAPRDKPLCVSENRPPLCPQPGRPPHVITDVLTTTNLLTRGKAQRAPICVGLTARAGQEQLSTTHSLAPLGATAGHVGATGDLYTAAWSRPQKAGPADSSGGGCQEALFICPPVQPLKQGSSMWAPRGHFGLHDLGCYRPERGEARDATKYQR